MLCRPSRKSRFGFYERPRIEAFAGIKLLRSDSESVVLEVKGRGANRGGPMKSSVVKRSIVIDGHKTSVSLEDAFWSDLKQIAFAQRATLSELVAKIDEARQQNNLSSAIRLFVLEEVRTRGVLREPSHPA